MLRGKGVHQILLSRHVMPLLLLSLLLLQFVITLVQQVATDTEATATPDKQKSDRVAIMDTMFWVGNTEFGQRDNWRKRVKPCTLLERIRINEQSVISMGDSMDALGGSLESNIKDLVMPINGMLLLEEDNNSDPLDPLFIQYLNQSGDCFDSSVYSEQGDSGFLFEFELDSDQFSWFNPDNWRSSLIGSQDYTVRLYPESHMIPCNHDVVVFGSRRMALKTTTEDNERSNTLTFKVNFRPSLAMIEELNFNETAIADFSFAQLRLFRIEIGNQSYDQQEFEQLINSDQYENILFQFNDNFSLLREETGFAYPSKGSLLTIDETTATSGLYYDKCQDEAGCICGNENTNVMKAICSFRNPIDLDQLPCHDPISSSGYCNKICATVLTIIMDPTKFKEAFVLRLLTKAAKSISQFKDDPSDESVINLRRTSENRYEITLSIQLTTTDGYVDYQSNSDFERQFAQNIFDQLDNAAKKSFYGIKSISLKSSAQWRTNNHTSIFMISFVVMLAGLMINFAREEVAKDKSRLISENEPSIEQTDCSILHRDWLVAIRRLFTQPPVQEDLDPSFIQQPEPSEGEDGFANESALEGSMSEIPLLDL